MKAVIKISKFTSSEGSLKILEFISKMKYNSKLGTHKISNMYKNTIKA